MAVRHDQPPQDAEREDRARIAGSRDHLLTPRDTYSDGGDDDDDGDDGGDDVLPDPLWLCRVVTRRPWLSFGVALGVRVLFVSLSVVLVARGYDLFPLELDTVPLFMAHCPEHLRSLAWAHRGETPDRGDTHGTSRTRWSRGGSCTRRCTRHDKSPVLLFDAGNHNLLTRRHLRLMQTMEDRLANVTGHSQMCQMTSYGTCHRPLSLLRFFDGSMSLVDPAFYDPDFRNVTGVIHRAFTLNATRSLLAFALPHTFTITPTRLHVPRTRSVMPLGDGHTYADLTVFMAKRWQPLLEKFLKTEQFEFLYFSELLMIRDAKAQAFVDMRLTLGSLLFIFAFIYFHTRSLWVTGLGGLSIVCSFVETNLVYRVLIGFRFFGLLHVLAMFIILGIGADDLFVFWDAWQASGRRRFPSLAHRLDAAYRQSAVSMLVTSLTTAMAFAVSALSPLLIVNSFGVFSAVLVAIDYVSVITFFPTIVVVYHVTWERRCRRCCLRPCCRCLHPPTADQRQDRDGGVTSEGQEVGSASDVPTLTPGPGDPELSRSRPCDPEGPPSAPGSGESPAPPPCPTDQHSGEALPEHRWLVKFFTHYHFRLMTHHVIRWLVLLVLMAVVAVLVFSASRLQPDHQQVTLFKESHHYSRGYRLATQGFLPSTLDLPIHLWLVWGLAEQDLSRCHFTDFRCQGDPVADEHFNPSTVPAQRGLMRLCDRLLTMSDQEYRDLHVQRDLVTGRPDIQCFTADMQRFFQTDPVLTGVDVSFPWTQRTVTSFRAALAPAFNLSNVNSSYPHVLDLAVSYWLSGGFGRRDASSVSFYRSLLGEERTAFTAPLASRPDILVGNRLKYVAVHVTLDLRYDTLFYTQHLAVQRHWERFLQSQMSGMPPEMQRGFVVTAVAWHLLHVQQNLVHNAWQGLALGIAIAAVILVVATGNVINGLLATLTIVCVTACVIGVVPLMGWRMGILVSLNMCLVVGLAVDYVVHLAEGYHLSSANSRRGRLRQSLGRLGISVFSGACTTLGASAFMLLAQIKFFFQFGIFMFFTIGFSVVFAFCFYVPLIGMLGPEGQFGDIRAIFRACMARMRCRQSNSRELPSLDGRRREDRVKSYFPYRLQAALDEREKGALLGP